jgi:mediator of RNA polymerase II transcription subunit 5
LGNFLPLCDVVTIFSSTRPKTLLAIAATVFLNAVKAAAEHKLDVDGLNNGISYFLGPLLRWTLPGIVLALVRQIRLTRWKQTSYPHYHDYRLKVGSS